MYVCEIIQTIIAGTNLHNNYITNTVLTKGRTVTAALTTQMMTATTQFVSLQELHVSSTMPCHTISFIPTPTTDHSRTGNLCNVENVHSYL